MAVYENLKKIKYDEDLRLEAYRFDGVVQAFPNHFHEDYVVGLVEAGQRRLTVNNREFHIGPGDLMTFNPMDSHACEQTDGGALRYGCVNLGTALMRSTACEVLGCDVLPRFREPVQYRTKLAGDFRSLLACIMDGAAVLQKEEAFLLFMRQLLSESAEQGGEAFAEARPEIEAVCTFLERHYAERITLDTLSAVARLNKYGLVRLFTRCKGITPYRYLETVRIEKAKELLEQGMPPAEVAQRTGFSDQSHFSSYFSRFIGLTPGQYQSVFLEGAL